MTQHELQLLVQEAYDMASNLVTSVTAQANEAKAVRRNSDLKWSDEEKQGCTFFQQEEGKYTPIKGDLLEKEGEKEAALERLLTLLGEMEESILREVGFLSILRKQKVEFDALGQKAKSAYSSTMRNTVEAVMDAKYHVRKGHVEFDAFFTKVSGEVLAQSPKLATLGQYVESLQHKKSIVTRFTRAHEICAFEWALTIETLMGELMEDFAVNIEYSEVPEIASALAELPSPTGFKFRKGRKYEVYTLIAKEYLDLKFTRGTKGLASEEDTKVRDLRVKVQELVATTKRG